MSEGTEFITTFRSFILNDGVTYGLETDHQGAKDISMLMEKLMSADGMSEEVRGLAFCIHHAMQDALTRAPNYGETIIDLRKVEVPDGQG